MKLDSKGLKDSKLGTDSHLNNTDFFVTIVS